LNAYGERGKEKGMHTKVGSSNFLHCIHCSTVANLSTGYRQCCACNCN